MLEAHQPEMEVEARRDEEMLDVSGEEDVGGD